MVSHVIWNAIFRSNYDIPEIALSGRAALWVHFLYTFGTLPCGYLKVFLRVLEGIPMIVEGPNGGKGDPYG
jgi:hypothetical protein